MPSLDQESFKASNCQTFLTQGKYVSNRPLQLDLKKLPSFELGTKILMWRRDRFS